MPAFPDYGELLLSGFNEKPESSIIRTEMESGPTKQARVRSKEQVSRNVTYRFTSEEYISWKVWRKNDIAMGSLYFDWTNPLTGNTVQGRMVNGDYEAQAFNANESAIKWDVSFVLETYE